MRFDYDRAFARNRGLVSASEQDRLRHSRVAIVGAGGVGGIHAITLARMGVGHFKIIDPDTFELANMNRQFGALVSTLGTAKATAIGRMIHDINPLATVEACVEALSARNAPSFLDEVDVVVDGIDAFAVEARITTYAACEERRIPVVTAGPIGMSATLHVFAPSGMSFERYFDFHPGQSYVQKLAAFLAGVAPKLSQRSYMDRGAVDVAAQVGPSLAPSCALCSGVVGIEVLRLLLGRAGLRPAPHYMQFDAYLGRCYRGYLWGGNRHPLQLLKRRGLERWLSESVSQSSGHAYARDAAGVA